jgi:hypothetical protein
MKEEQDYIRDIAEMRSMMERSSKFLSLSGLAGIMAGIYALSGAFIVYKVFDFNPDQADLSSGLVEVILTAFIVLVLAIGTAIILSYRNANKRREKFWDPTARRVLINLGVPLLSGGLLIIILISKGMIGLAAPFTLIFYGLALYNAGKFTYEEMKSLGLIQIALGLISSYFVEYSLIFWAIGFGIFHIIYGIYIHYRHER